MNQLTSETTSPETKRKLAQLAAVVDSSHDAIMGGSLDGIVTSWNPAAERLYGYTAEEILGQPFAVLLLQSAPMRLPRTSRNSNTWGAANTSTPSAAERTGLWLRCP